jgi:hypothetical protein
MHLLNKSFGVQTGELPLGSETVLHMFSDDRSPQRSNDEVESFIGENLSIFQSKWLRTQSEALRTTRTEILEAILTEWLAAHPPAIYEYWQDGELVRRAVADFILCHHAEFLPMSSPH